MSDKIKVGCGVLLFNDKGQILLHERIGDHGKNTFGSGGGHLEFNETPEQCVIRELKEEMMIDIGELEYLGTVNFITGNKHYIDISFRGKILSGIPTVPEDEKDKIGSIDWYDTSNLPEPLFPPVKLYLDMIETGNRYMEIIVE